MKIILQPLLLLFALILLIGCQNPQAASPTISPQDTHAASPTTFSYDFVEWNQTMPRKRKLISKEEGFCCLAGVFGNFNGGGEFVKLYIDPVDNFWYFEGRNAAGLGGCQILIVRTSQSAARLSQPAAPTSLIGTWEMDVVGYHPFPVIVQPNNSAKGDNNMSGTWQVTDGNLSFRWPNGATDTFKLDRSDKLTGTSSPSGVKLTLTRKSK